MNRTWRCQLHRNRKLLVFGCLYALVSVFAMAHFLSSSYLGDRYESTAFDSMLSGKAARPFVYRVLVPKLTQAITDATPGQWQSRINDSVRNWLSAPQMGYVMQAMPWIGPTYDVRNPYPRLVATGLIYLSLIGYAGLLFKLAQAVAPTNEPLRWFAPLFGLLAISAFSLPWQYIYDIPVLFLSSACFYFLYTRRIKAYLLCFLLACLNRETSVFIFLFFLIWSARRLPRPTFIALAAAQAVIWLGIKVTLTYVYMDNPGAFLEYNLARVLRLDIMERAGLSRILVLGMLFFLFTYRWQDKPDFFKCGLWILPAIYAAYIFYGNGEEYRVFFDIAPLMILLATHTLTEAAGFSRLPLFNAAATKEP